MSGLVKDEIEMPENEEARGAVGDYKAGWHDPENSTIRFDFGLSEEVVREISKLKEEPEWMTEIRVRAFEHFSSRPMPTWGNTSMLEEIDFDKICYYLIKFCYFVFDWHTTITHKESIVVYVISGLVIIVVNKI